MPASSKNVSDNPKQLYHYLSSSPDIEFMTALSSNYLYTGSTLLLQGLCANTSVQLLDLKVSRPVPWAVEREKPRDLCLDNCQTVSVRVHNTQGLMTAT